MLRQFSNLTINTNQQHQHAFVIAPTHAEANATRDYLRQLFPDFTEDPDSPPTRPLILFGKEPWMTSCHINMISGFVVIPRSKVPANVQIDTATWTYRNLVHHDARHARPSHSRY